MAGWFELKKSKSDEFYFVLKAGNGEIVLTSEMYKARPAADNGIESVRKNCALNERYEKTVTAAGKFRFNLKAANHQVIGASQQYDTEAGRDAGIESVKTNGTSATVKELLS